MTKPIALIIPLLVMWIAGCMCPPDLPQPPDRSARAVEEANLKLAEILKGSLEETSWSNESLRSQLPEWQSDFLLAMMYAGLCENGGDYHGVVLSTRGNELEAIAETWKRVGAWETGNAIIRLGALAQSLGWDPETQDLDDLPTSVQRELEEFLEDQSQETSAEWNVLLFAYYNENFQKTQRDASTRPDAPTNRGEPDDAREPPR